MGKPFDKFKDDELMLYMAILIWKLRDEITHTLSLMPEMEKELADKIFEKHLGGYCSFDILTTVLKKKFPEIYSEKGKSLKRMFEESDALLNEILR